MHACGRFLEVIYVGLRGRNGSAERIDVFQLNPAAAVPVQLDDAEGPHWPFGRFDAVYACEFLDEMTRQSAARCGDDQVHRTAFLKHRGPQNVEQADAIEVVE